MDEIESRLTGLLPRLRRFAHGLTRDAAEADDLVQATAERVLRSGERWQAGTNFDAWVYRVMRNLWIDITRSSQRRERVLAPEDDGLHVGIPGEAEAAVELRFLMRAMDRLPDEQREAVALVMIEGLAYVQAAEILEIPMGTLTSRLVRGRQALVKMLED